MKKTLAWLLAALCLLASGCTDTAQAPSAPPSVATPQRQTVESRLSQFSGSATVTAQIATSLGDITLALYPEYAPLAVHNFCLLAASGAYNGTEFHRAVAGFVAQGGDTAGDGSLGASAWQTPFGNEANSRLYHFAGALCTASDTNGRNGSQFYLVAAEPGSLNANDLEALRVAGYSEEAIAAYAAAGGLPYLDYADTVFGQVLAGMDVVDAIAYTQTDEAGRLLTPVTIQSVIVTGYTW